MLILGVQRVPRLMFDTFSGQKISGSRVAFLKKKWKTSQSRLYCARWPNMFIVLMNSLTHKFLQLICKSGCTSFMNVMFDYLFKMNTVIIFIHHSIFNF